MLSLSLTPLFSNCTLTTHAHTHKNEQNPGTIPYKVGLMHESPGWFRIFYVPNRTVHHEIVTLRPAGYRLRSRTFTTLTDMFEVLLCVCLCVYVCCFCVFMCVVFVCCVCVCVCVWSRCTRLISFVVSLILASAFFAILHCSFLCSIHNLVFDRDHWVVRLFLALSLRSLPLSISMVWCCYRPFCAQQVCFSCVCQSHHVRRRPVM
jgi:hypothetical protein